MNSKKTSMILSVLILTSLLTVFQNCGDVTQIDPMDESGLVTIQGGAEASGSPTQSQTGSSSPAPTTPGQAAELKISTTKFLIMRTAKTSLIVVGGQPPYSYTVSPNSAGSVNAAVPEFLANQPGVATIEVTDSLGKTASVAISVL